MPCKSVHNSLVSLQNCSSRLILALPRTVNARIFAESLYPRRSTETLINFLETQDVQSTGNQQYARNEKMNDVCANHSRLAGPKSALALPGPHSGAPFFSKLDIGDDRGGPKGQIWHLGAAGPAPHTLKAQPLG